MFRLYEDFKVYDDNMQPYSLEMEKHTDIDNLHTGVENGEFALKSIGNRSIFKTPMLSDFSFVTHFGFTTIYVVKTSFTVFYGYNKKTRSGYGVSIRYNLDNTITVSHLEILKSNSVVLDEVNFDGTVVEGNRYELSLIKKGNVITGTVMGNQFSFKTEADKGYLGLFRPNYIGMCLISDVLIESDDEVNCETVMDSLTITIPVLNGGDIPYEVTMSAVQENECCYLYAELGGGTATRKENREDRPGQYVAEIDQLYSPYLTFVNGEREEKVYFFRDREVLADPNIYWDCLKEYWNMPEFPIKRRFALPKELFSGDVTITFGYEKFEARGYMVNSGGPSEFIFERNGKLLYGGSALTQDAYEIESPKDKKIISLIPEDTYDYEKVKVHLETNHYFMLGEDIKLDLVMITEKQNEFLNAEAEIKDIYDTKILLKLSAKKIKTEELLGRNKITWSANSNTQLSEGLYRIVYSVLYGDRVIKKFERVFEVLDPESDISPAMASGLPFVFSMPNEHKWLERNSFDLWNPMPSCDVEHYISCVTDTPVEAEKRRVWELLPVFKRKYFAWIDNRTCRDWKNEDHTDVIKNCDYLYYPIPTQLYPVRNDLFLLQTYTYSPRMRNILKEFLELNPQIAEKLSFSVEGGDENEVVEMLFDAEEVDVGFTYENLKELLDLCYVEWTDFLLKYIREDVKKQNKELLEINPDFKRAALGPCNQYVNSTFSYRSIRDYGILDDEGLASELYTGFAMLEDYPKSCSYQTYRAVYLAMSTLLHVPSLVIYPEQYRGSTLGGCIDGAVKFANAPMGAYPMMPYENSTSSYEYVFNTPQRIAGGYKYWDTYGFHRADFPPEMWNSIAKDWKNVLDYKPKRPLKTVGFIAEYTDEECIFDAEIETLHKSASIKNRSEQGHGFLYDCSREAGLNAGFVIKSETLKELNADECEILMLPTLKNASKETISQIRRLHSEGVALVAASDITGLEDIFGVELKKKTEVVDTIYYKGQAENVYPMETELYYEATTADVLVATEVGTPIVTKNGNAILLNAIVTDIGYEAFAGMQGKCKHCLSKLLKTCLKKCMRELSSGFAIGENVGISLFETQKNETVLLAIDYSPYDNTARGVKKASVDISLSDVKAVESDREIICLKNKEGNVVRVEFDIRFHESVFIKLIRK